MKASLCLIAKGKDTELKLTQRESGLGVCVAFCQSLVENVGCIALLQYGLTSETEIQVDLITKLKEKQKRLFIDLTYCYLSRKGIFWIGMLSGGQKSILGRVHPQESNPSPLDPRLEDYAQKRMKYGVVTLH